MMKCKIMALLLLCTTAGKAQNLTGAWTGMLDAGAVKLNLVFHLQQVENGKDYCLMDSPDQSVKGVPTQLLFVSADSLSVEVRSIGTKYNGKLEGETLKGVFEQMGRRFNLDLKQQVLAYRRPQHPVAPFPYTTKEVSFTNSVDTVTLAGALTYPVGYTSGDKVPVVLMVTGSGPEDRDETIYEHKPFWVIADYLARKGIATLRYDDRAVGKSTGRRMAFTTKEVADDAKAGIAFLRQMDCFSRIGLLGHSEGATVGFMLGAEKRVDFVVSLAGVGVKGDDCLYSQAKKITALSGQPLTMGKEQYVEMALKQGNPWLDYFLRYDAQTDIRQTTCPVFALNGDKDVQVVADLNLPGIEKNLPQNAKTKVKRYPGLNHLFQKCQTGLPTEYSQIEQTISTEVLEDIAAWINAL